MNLNSIATEMKTKIDMVLDAYFSDSTKGDCTRNDSR